MLDVLAPFERYAERCTTPVEPHLRAVLDRTRREEPDAGMLTGELEGRFLEFLSFAVRPRLVVEIGTYTGFSALAMAAGLAPDGRVLTCELDPEHARIARENIADSPYAARIEVREGPALATIGGLADGAADLVFVDADKRSYPDYYEAVLPKLSDRGLLVVDNVLWGGAVLDPADRSPDTEGVRTLAARAANDERVVAVLLTVRDGVLLVRRAQPA